MEAAGGSGDGPHTTFALESEIVGATQLVSVAGELDLVTAPRLQQVLEDVERAGAPAVVLDLSRVEFIDSSGLRVLIVSARRLEEARSELHVACAQGPVRRLFELTAVATEFALHERRTDALAAAAPAGEGKGESGKGGSDPAAPERQARRAQ